MTELFTSEISSDPGWYWMECHEGSQFPFPVSSTMSESSTTWKIGPRIPTPEECDLFHFWAKNTTQLEVFKHSRGDVCAQMKFDCTVRGFGVDGFAAIQDLRKKWKEISDNDASKRTEATTPATN